VYNEYTKRQSLVHTENIDAKGVRKIMQNEIATKFPEAFPDNFETDILPKNIPPLTLQVYRICISGIIDKNAFLNTYESVQQGLQQKPPEWDLDDPGIYSTSCFEKVKDARNILKCLKKYNPPAFIMAGEAPYTLGPLQRTIERTGKKTSHIDWWLYRDADPSRLFYKKIKG